LSDYARRRFRSSGRLSLVDGSIVPHTFRFIGLSFLVPGVVSPTLSQAFAAPAAYGDLIAAVLAVAAILSLRSRAI
jgi:hypothetical protein